MDTKNRELSREEKEMFAAWRAGALEKMPYLSMLLFTMRPVSSTWTHFAAVDDGLRLYLNFENIAAEGPAFGTDALLHECSHVIAQHSKIARQIGIMRSEHDLWNAAADLAINDDLVEAGCKSFETKGLVPWNIRLNGTPLKSNLTPNEYFFMLRKAQKPSQQSGGQGQQGNQQGQGNQPGQGQGNQPGQGQGNQPGQGQGNQPGQGQGNQPGQGQGGTPSDQPLFKGCGSGSGGQTGPGELQEGDDLGGNAPSVDESTVDYILQETARAIEEHIKTRGTVPGGMEEIVDKLKQKDEIRWEKVLSSMFRRGCQRVKGRKIDTFRRPNRRKATAVLRDGAGVLAGRIIYPSKEKYVPKIRVYIDSSGSVSRNELDKALAVVMNLSKRMKIKGENLTVTYVDARVHETNKFTGLSSVNNVKGRGGTDMRECFIDSDDQKKKPDLIVVITDGFTPWPETAPSYGTIICLTQEQPTPTWAKTVMVKPEKVS